MDHIYNEPQFAENWFTYSNFYSEMVKKFPSESKFVEIGCWKGRSASCMAVEIANSGKNIDFYCVDHWKGSSEHIAMGIDLSTLYDTFKTNMDPVKDYYTDIKLNSVDAAATFADETLDFIFIDASHEYESVKSDISAWLPKLKVGGIISGHDYHYPPVKQAVDENNFSDLQINAAEDVWIYCKS
jgi:predicted O-methyltransferase YrrM